MKSQLRNAVKINELVENPTNNEASTFIGENFNKLVAHVQKKFGYDYDVASDVVCDASIFILKKEKSGDAFDSFTNEGIIGIEQFVYSYINKVGLDKKYYKCKENEVSLSSLGVNNGDNSCDSDNNNYVENKILVDNSSDSYIDNLINLTDIENDIEIVLENTSDREIMIRLLNNLDVFKQDETLIFRLPILKNIREDMKNSPELRESFMSLYNVYVNNAKAYYDIVSKID